MILTMIFNYSWWCLFISKRIWIRSGIRPEENINVKNQTTVVKMACHRSRGNIDLHGFFFFLNWESKWIHCPTKLSWSLVRVSHRPCIITNEWFVSLFKIYVENCNHLYYYLRNFPCLDSSFFSSKIPLHFYV